MKRGRHLRALTRLIVGGLIIAAAALANTMMAAASPGVPAAPATIFNENFQNSVASRVLLTSYTGAAGMTYTADSPWLTNCNGEILSFSTPDSEFSNSNCSVGNGGAGSGTNLTGAYDNVRRIAYALGQLNNTASPGTNKSLTAYTDYGNAAANPGPNFRQLETVNAINLPAGSRRFVISQVNIAAVNCGANDGQIVFYLLDGPTARRINQNAINVCNDSAATTYTPPTLQTNGAAFAMNNSIKAGHVFTDRAILTDTQSLGLRMINEQGSGSGNDNGIDDIVLSDASPRLSKNFSAGQVATGSSVTLTLTITNTTDLLAKAGWSFRDSLPSGLKIASTPNITSNCTNGSLTATVGSSVIDVHGDLLAGQSSCSFSVKVTASKAGTYANGAANISQQVGILDPDTATVIFLDSLADTGGNWMPAIPAAVIVIISVTAVIHTSRRKFYTVK